uniref:DUF4810 domain-containing protein n=1 Tax=Rheinheimera sp. TaxID=1869214 RepID=UPI004048A0C3
MKIFPLLIVLVLFSGCTTAPVEYFYGNYSQTLYRSKKDATPQSLEKHRQSLQAIIEKSEKKGIKVPPGIYCEYAYLLAKEGSPEADRYFSLEVKTYPESERFVSFVRSQLESS